MLKKTTGAFDGARTHDLHILSQTCNPLRHAALIYSDLLLVVYTVIYSSLCIQWFTPHCVKSDLLLVVYSDLLLIVYTVIYSSLCIEWFTPRCEYSDLLLIVYTVIYSSFCIQWFTPRCVYSDLLLVVYTVIYSSLCIKWLSRVFLFNCQCNRVEDVIPV